MAKKTEIGRPKPIKKHHSKATPKKMSKGEFNYYVGSGSRGCQCERTSWWTHHRYCTGGNCASPNKACWFDSDCPEKGSKQKHRLYY